MPLGFQLLTLATGLFQASDPDLLPKNNFFNLTCMLFLRVLNKTKQSLKA